MIAVSSSEEKSQYVKQLGAHSVVSRKESGLANAVLRESQQNGADIVVDFVGGDNFETNLSCMVSWKKRSEIRMFV